MWVIDFEASGLDKRSYPIEVGITNGKDCYSSLIKPFDTWQYWSNDAEAIHRIPRNQLLEQGEKAELVANSLNNHLNGDVVYCDAIAWDTFWCQVLFSYTGIHQQFELRTIESLLSDEQHLAQYLMVKDELEASGRYVAHRALDDAKLIHKTYEMTAQNVKK